MRGEQKTGPGAREDALQQQERFLFERIAMGDEMAFKQLFQRYGPIIAAAIRKVTRSEAVVPDILQDVFLKLWLKKEQLTSVDYPRRWVLQIAYHESFNWLKKQKVAQKHLEALHGEQLSYVAQSPTSEVEAGYLYKETADRLSEVVDSLPPKAKQVYRLNRENGLRISEIASELKISNQTVKNTLGRAIRSIRLKMGETRFFVLIALSLLLS
jgi:RNA polymerase sigma-70 factor (ECF subfamily)